MSQRDQSDYFLTLGDRLVLRQLVLEDEEGKPNTALLGSGSYGKVYLSTSKSGLHSAVKLSELKHPNAIREHRENTLEEAQQLDQPGYIDTIPHYESTIMLDLINMGCPNLPIIYSHIVGYRGQQSPTRQLLVRTELYDTDLRNAREIMADEQINTELLNNLLFQALAGVNCLHRALIIHYDIKSRNMLLKKITPGGYWHYVIDGLDYYVPNLGYLLAVTDFGFSRRIMEQLDSLLWLSRTDSQTNVRYLSADGVPVKVNPGEPLPADPYKPFKADDKILSGEYFPAQLSYDTQDVISMFLGGELSAYVNKDGRRDRYSAALPPTSEFTEQLSPYRSELELRWEAFHPLIYHHEPRVIGDVDERFLLSGQLLKSYFTNFTDYFQPVDPAGNVKEILAEYQLS